MKNMQNNKSPGNDEVTKEFDEGAEAKKKRSIKDFTK